MAKAAEKKNSNDFRRYVKWMWILIFSIPLSLFLLFFVTWLELFTDLPSVEDIANPPTKLASQIISSDGEEIGKFYIENRTKVNFNQLSPYLSQALVATEDERFYGHSGIDFRGLARAIYGLGKKGGASTITQQLAKMQFTQRSSNLVKRAFQKVQEYIISVQIERLYTKEEIIAAYFNQMDFIYQGVGIASASRIYFNTTPDSLKLEEAAVLVGMCKNPDLYNPKKRPENAIERRNQVFFQMLRNKLITPEERDSLSQLPLVVKYTPQGHDQGLAPYFREYLRSYMKEWLAEYEERTGNKLNLYTDGLKIFTTIDSRMQQYAEEAVEEHLSNLQRVFFKVESGRKYRPFHFDNNSEEQIGNILNQGMKGTQRYKTLKADGVPMDSILKVFNTPIPMTVFAWGGDKDTVLSPMDSIRYYKHFYQVGMMSVEPQTGFVKAWVGGIDFRYFKYDHVKQGKRQVGSTFKPFVYASSITQKHYSPCMQVPNVRTCIESGTFDLLKDWCPENSDNKYGGMLTLQDALAQSKNTVTTYLMKQIGPGPVIELARKMGVQGDIPIQPSIALGTVDLSVYEMVGSYTTFANKGIYTEPIMVTRIEDKNGVILDEFVPTTNEVMREEDAYVVVSLLKGVTRSGTGVRLRTSGANYPNKVVTGYPYAFKNPIAGKTGTTQKNADGWFMGMVPNLITGVWTGCDNRAAHFGATMYGQGATTALPIWGIFMRKCYANPDLGISKEDFERPESELTIELDCDKYNGTSQPGEFNEEDEF